MMDIVKRLRVKHPDTSGADRAIKDWAADEIERLRAENIELRTSYTEVSDRAYRRLSELRYAEDEIERLGAALEEIISEQYGGDKCEELAKQALKQSEKDSVSKLKTPNESEFEGR